MPRLPLTLLMLVLPAAPAAADLKVENLPPRVWAGSKVEVDLGVSRAPRDQDLRLLWAWVWPGQKTPLLPGRLRLQGPGTYKTDLTVPSIRVRHKMGFSARVCDARGNVLAEVHRTVEVFPGSPDQVVRAANRGRTVGIVEVGIKENALTDRLPIPFKRLGSAAAVRHFDGRLVIVHADRPFHRRSAVAAALLEQAQEGVKIVCLGKCPSPLPLDTLSRRATEVVAREVRLLAPDHPIFANLGRKDLSNWGRSGVVAHAVVPLPDRGNYLMLADLAGGGEPRPVMVETWHGPKGQGRVVCCGLDVADKFSKDPIAAILMANLLRWGAEENRPARLVRPVGYFREDSPVRNVLRTVVTFGSRAATGPHISFGDGAILEKSHSTAMDTHLRDGGTLVLFCLFPRDMEALNEALRKRWQRDTRAEVPLLVLRGATGGPVPGGALRARHPLLAGVRPEDVAELVKDAQQRDARAVKAAADTGHFRSLLRRGLVAKYERDDVRIVFWQLPLHPQGGGNGAWRRTLTALLTNLGVHVHPLNR